MSTVTAGVKCSISTLKPSFASSLRFRRVSFPLLSPRSALCFSGKLPSHSNRFSFSSNGHSNSAFRSLRVCLSETMDCGDGGPYVFPLHRCKTIHLVRHGQGIHNVEGDKNYDAYMKSEYFDAHITPLGWQEVDNLRKHVHDSGIMKKIDLVIVSPLLRTLQTAVGVFGGEGYTDRTDVLPLMVENAGNSNRAAISSLNCPPIVAFELCRERMIDSNEDTWWKTDVRETKEEIACRGLKFMNWLGTRKEKEIAIVTHRAFLFHTLGAFGNYSHHLEKKELSKPFANCELRSVVIVDRYEYILNNFKNPLSPVRIFLLISFLVV
ncbi:hypothetical protein V8G54_031762 [Vigna mungo]|uniref:Phosphoglycerate mutase-like protein 1 n=1 Tax=Vigna mungo TaxID=3915 RepID=A0AAQ3MKR6_VIGMU